ncbi:hypothetical protein QOZ80_3AG0232380 [Eleusine coracana subsp. coracana]|nr:hypothetical protein QOZ80_3AG0232380 [Eleusine coracana subsp. coracana]
MEFTLEASHSYGVFQEDVPYSCNMRQYPKSGGLNHSPAPIKKLIHDDISFMRTNESHKRPGVIARLMGMDSPPLNTTTESSSHSEERRHEIVSRPMPRRDQAEMPATKHVSFVQHNKEETEDLFAQPSKKKNSEWGKPQPREHPQEEELQKFKKEFEAWQTSRLWEQQSRSLEAESHLDDDDDCTDMVPYRYQQKAGNDAKTGSRHKHYSKDDGVNRRRSKKDESSTSISGSRTFSLTSSSRLPLSRFYQYHKEEEEEEEEEPTRIVILKPCPELSTDDIEESSVGSPELVKKENNMEAFLEEVKKRLKIELEGRRMASDDNKADRWDVVPADPKQIARNIANQIRENVARRDLLHPALVRSESTRSYRSDVQLNGQSPMMDDYIGRDARRHLSDRLKNVLRWDAEEPPRHDMASRKQQGKKIRSKEEKKCAIEYDVRSLRHDGSHKTSSPPNSQPVSPRNLVRSMSAPVSWTKLLTEEQPRVLTGARQQEGTGARPLAEERKGRKDAFNIKGKVSNLKQNLGLRAKLFGKKFYHADESFPDDLPPIGTLVTAPSVLIHPGVLQENSTEVPPSPASWCSSPPDEMIRGGYPSPVSPLEASFSEHRSSPLRTAAKDTSSSTACEQVVHVHEEEDTDELDDPAKSFVRAVLIAAGMYGHRQTQNPGSDCEPKLILPKRVLDEVAESTTAAITEAVDDHRLLFDLINEALPGAVRASTTLCTFEKCYYPRRKAAGGKKLLDVLWKSLQAWLQPPCDDATSGCVDGLIDRDLSASPWNGVFRDDTDALGVEVEVEILDELIDETLWDVLLNVGD